MRALAWSFAALSCISCSEENPDWDGPKTPASTTQSAPIPSNATTSTGGRADSATDAVTGSGSSDGSSDGASTETSGASSSTDPGDDVTSGDPQDACMGGWNRICGGECVDTRKNPTACGDGCIDCTLEFGSAARCRQGACKPGPGEDDG